LSDGDGVLLPAGLSAAGDPLGERNAVPVRELSGGSEEAAGPGVEERTFAAAEGGVEEELGAPVVEGGAAV